MSDAGWHVIPVPRIRDGKQAGEVERSIKGADVFVNAAGCAGPHSTNLDELDRANAQLPVRLYQLANDARIGRFIHVSSAAVQGGKAELTDEADFAPFSPYARSKVEGEQGLLAAEAAGGPVLKIYRPTSVMGTQRKITQSLVALYGRSLALVAGDGQNPLPITSIQAVGRFAVDLVDDNQSKIRTHPWDGITQLSLARLFMSDSTRLVHLPWPRNVIGYGLDRAMRFDRLAGRVRQVEMLTVGQRAETESDHADQRQVAMELKIAATSIRNPGRSSCGVHRT